jgi:hypothetical protein
MTAVQWGHGGWPNGALRGQRLGAAGDRARENEMESESVSMARIHAAIERLKAEGIDDPTPDEVMDVVAEMQREGEAGQAANAPPTQA